MVSEQLIFEIAVKGCLPAGSQWKDLKYVLLVLMKDACVFMNEKYPDIQRTINCNFEDSFKDLVDLLLSFEKECVQ